MRCLAKAAPIQWLKQGRALPSCLKHSRRMYRRNEHHPLPFTVRVSSAHPFGCCRRIRIKMRQKSRFTILPALLLALLGAAPVSALEPGAEASAESLLGPNITGRKWSVAPIVRNDGIIWIFTVKSAYGDFQVNGLRRMQDRLQELRALESLEKMSRTKAFVGATVRAGLAPVRFGRDLIVSPFETVGNFFSGVGKTLDTVAAGATHPGAGRDPFFRQRHGHNESRARAGAQAWRRSLYGFQAAALRAGRRGPGDDGRRSARDRRVSRQFPAEQGLRSAARPWPPRFRRRLHHTSRELFEIIAATLKGLNVDAVTTRNSSITSSILPPMSLPLPKP